MKNYLEARKEELKKRGNKGFTLMEMLIVVAIIAILIAIAIPIFTSQLESARDATSVANIRSAYAEASAAYLLPDSVENNDNISVDLDSNVVTVDGIVIESAQANQWSGQAGDLPFSNVNEFVDADPGEPGTVQGTFMFNDDGTVSVTIS